MAVDAYMVFIPYKGNAVASESQVNIVASASQDPLGSILSNYNGSIFEVEDYSFDIEQTLNIGSQSQGAGAGKITFNPFSITRKIDKASPAFFLNCCAGTPFKVVFLFLRKSQGVESAGATTQAGVTFARFDFKLVAVKTLAWAHDDESPKETITFEYGAMQVNYALQQPSGDMQNQQATGWNRVQNVSYFDATGTAPIIPG
jgi:type VI secretion system Hcp family effector